MSEKEFEGRVAVVTGARRGIGAEIALALAERGAAVALVGRTFEGSDAADRAAAANGGRAKAFLCDVSSSEEVARTFAEIEKEFGRIDFLVNNAGIVRDALVARMTDDQFDDVVRNNLRSVFLCTRAVSRAMVKARFGRIVNVASVVALRPSAGLVGQQGVHGLIRQSGQHTGGSLQGREGPAPVGHRVQLHGRSLLWKFTIIIKGSGEKVKPPERPLQAPVRAADGPRDRRFRRHPLKIWTKTTTEVREIQRKNETAKM